MQRLISRANHRLERYLPEQRLFLRSEQVTRFLRLTPLSQALGLAMVTVVAGWTILATAIVIIEHISSGGTRDQALRAQTAYEARLDSLSRERDAATEALDAAQKRFAVALEQISTMQSALLASEERRRELETGIGVIQSTLREAMVERDSARAEAARLTTAMAGDTGSAATPQGRAEDMADTLSVMTAALGETAAERDTEARAAAAARAEADEILLEKRLMEERTDEIFTRLEEAVTVSMEPLDKMFSAAGLDPDEILSQVRRGYSGQGGPLMPISFSTKGDATAMPEYARAATILDGLDRMNMYRIATEKSPFAMPINTGHRFTSGFGARWGRLHAGIDLAGSYGSPVSATADGTVVFAGWMNGYGRLVRIRHAFGLETRYGHLSQIRVSVGQKVSRGDRIGDMGNSGRSTGTHLHYEIRVGGSPVNPMTFIKAANNVF